MVGKHRASRQIIKEHPQLPVKSFKKKITTSPRDRDLLQTGQGKGPKAGSGAALTWSKP